MGVSTRQRNWGAIAVDSDGATTRNRNKERNRHEPKQNQNRLTPTMKSQIDRSRQVWSSPTSLGPIRIGCPIQNDPVPQSADQPPSGS